MKNSFLKVIKNLYNVTYLLYLIRMQKNIILEVYKKLTIYFIYTIIECLLFTYEKTSHKILLGRKKIFILI